MNIVTVLGCRVSGLGLGFFNLRVQGLVVRVWGLVFRV